MSNKTRSLLTLIVLILGVIAANYLGFRMNTDTGDIANQTFDNINVVRHGGNAGLCAEGRRRGAAFERLRRQDHHLSAFGRKRAGAAGPGLARSAGRLDGRGGAARRRFPA